MSKELEFRPVTAKELVDELEALVEQMSDPERKYQLQVGLKDVELEVEEERARDAGISFPLSGIEQAEGCLRARILAPSQFVEIDGTIHEVAAFDPRPVGFSGFMDCVTHSLAITDRGLFEVGRYPGVSLTQASKVWQWFIHRRLLTTEQMEQLENAGRSREQTFDLVYEALVGRTIKTRQQGKEDLV